MALTNSDFGKWTIYGLVYIGCLFNLSQIFTTNEDTAVSRLPITNRNTADSCTPTGALPVTLRVTTFSSNPFGSIINGQELGYRLPLNQCDPTQPEIWSDEKLLILRRVLFQTENHCEEVRTGRQRKGREALFVDRAEWKRGGADL